MSADEVREALERCRAAEKEQALYYRALGALAQERGDEALASRFQDLHADEQHHLSRLTARLVELSGRPAELGAVRAPAAELGAWEAVAAERERAEVRRYERLLRGDLDPTTATVVGEILAVERQHSTKLGGKWTLA